MGTLLATRLISAHGSSTTQIQIGGFHPVGYAAGGDDHRLAGISTIHLAPIVTANQLDGNPVLTGPATSDVDFFGRTRERQTPRSHFD